MKRLVFVFVITTFLVPSALADNKSISLSDKQLMEVEALLDSHGFNALVTKGTKVFLKNDKEGYTSTIILALRNLDRQRDGVYLLHFKKTKLIKILWLEDPTIPGGERVSGEKVITPSAITGIKFILLSNKKVGEIATLLKSHGFNLLITRGYELILKEPIDGNTRTIVLRTWNLNNGKGNGIYKLNYKKTELTKVIWLEGGVTGEKIITP